jgi:hypothetical protein
VSTPAPGYAPRVSSSAVARAVFALLVVATGAAFFVTQRLKTSDPVVKRLALQRFFSPNGDGRKETAGISFQLPKGDRVTVDVVDGGGDRVRRLADGRSLGAGTHRLTWDGRNDRGRVPAVACPTTPPTTCAWCCASRGAPSPGRAGSC